ncbi:MAG: excinuclease subunit [Chitinophagaceae bacterium]|nr:excinuclease subunit [Chitinophagaceae bacterium]
MTSTEFQQLIHKIPTQPGIYKYYDDKGALIYVGKAKNLKKRVASYFSKTLASYKTHELVQRIRKIEFTIVNSEQDALFLENSLIKEYQPLFNINLKDDKSYPFIVIKKEPFPRVFLTRRKYDDGSEYLGPFTSVARVRELLNFIRSNIPLRTCKLNLTRQNIERKKFKVCLEYHLGNCKGPCEGLQSEDDYLQSLQQIKNLLRGNLTPVIQQFKSEMNRQAANMEFEQAELTRKKIEHLENYEARSVVVSKHIFDVDVFTMIREYDNAYVNYLMVKNGTIVQTHTIQLKTPLEETDEEVLAFAISNLRQTFSSTAIELIVPFPLEYHDSNIVSTVPKGGDKKKLLDLSLKNVEYFKEDLHRKKILQLEGSTDKEKKQVLYKMQHDLHLSELPLHIECFDNSNFQGSFPVAAMVCFKEGVPSKDDYRHFNIKTVEGINDFASMKEVVQRRYKRVVAENRPLPQLVIIDGGKGQLNAAVEALESLNIRGQLNIIGLAKNEEEIFFPGDMQSMKLPWDSESLKLIRRIRDEVHRFGITFHRKQRSRGTFKNELEDIKGIGKQTADLLLKKYRSVKNIRNLSMEDLAADVGTSKARIIKQYFDDKG